MKKILPFLFTSFFICSHVFGEPLIAESILDAVDGETYESFTASKDYFTCKIPKSWKVEKASNEDTTKQYGISLSKQYVPNEPPPTISVYYFAKDNTVYGPTMGTYIKQRKKMVESQDPGKTWMSPINDSKVNGHNAKVIEITHSTIWPPSGPNAKEFMMKEQTAVIPADEGFYTLTIDADVNNFYPYFFVYVKIWQSFTPGSPIKTGAGGELAATQPDSKSNQTNAPAETYYTYLEPHNYFKVNLPKSWSEPSPTPSYQEEVTKQFGVFVYRHVTLRKLPARIAVYYYAKDNSVHRSMDDYIRVRNESAEMFGDTLNLKPKPVTETVMNGRTCKVWVRESSAFWPPYQTNPIKYSQTEKAILIPESEGFYELRYEAPTENFKELEPAFDEAVKSFTPMFKKIK